jgi:hypothetical protein
VPRTLCDKLQIPHLKACHMPLRVTIWAIGAVGSLRDKEVWRPQDPGGRLSNNFGKKVASCISASFLAHCDVVQYCETKNYGRSSVFWGDKSKKGHLGISFNYLRPRQLFETVHFDNEFRMMCGLMQFNSLNFRLVAVAERQLIRFVNLKSPYPGTYALDERSPAEST